MGMIGGLTQSDENVEILRPPSVVPEMPPTKLPDAETADEPLAPESAAAQVDEITEKNVSPDVSVPKTTDQPVGESGTQTAAAHQGVSQATGKQQVAGAGSEEEQNAVIAVPTTKPKPPKR